MWTGADWQCFAVGGELCQRRPSFGQSTLLYSSAKGESGEEGYHFLEVFAVEFASTLRLVLN